MAHFSDHNVEYAQYSPQMIKKMDSKWLSLATVSILGQPPRIRVETEAILAILALAQSKEFLLLSSDALEYEINRIPDAQRRYEAMAVLALADERLTILNETQQLAEALESQGFNPMDAVHLALASTAKSDFFVTCDDSLLRKSRKLTLLSCKVVSILDFIVEVTK